MPGRRYYCYYCDVSFPYSREARKRHNGGHTHARLATQHYQQHQNSRERYNTETNKEKCRKFLSGKGCNFGEECIYSHTTPQQLEELRLEAEQESILEAYGPLPSQVTSALSTPSSTNIFALDSVAITKMIITQRRQRLLSLYPAQLFHHSNTATVIDNNTSQPTAAAASQSSVLTECEFATATPTTECQSYWSTHDASKMNTSLPGPAKDVNSSKLGEGKAGYKGSLRSRTDFSTQIPPSMLPYTFDTMLSKPLPDWR